MVAMTAAMMVAKLGATLADDWAVLMAGRKAVKLAAHLVGCWAALLADTKAADLAWPLVACSADWWVCSLAVATAES